MSSVHTEGQVVCPACGWPLKKQGVVPDIRKMPCCGKSLDGGEAAKLIDALGIGGRS